ncbi:glycosyltransferase family 9 protein [Caballeronia sp. KNU42]
MPHAIQPLSNVALILSSALGDSLLMMTVARNLRLNGVSVTVFGQQINNMRSWFPGIDIEPELKPDDCAAKLARFDTVIQLHANKPFVNLERLHPKVIVLAHLCSANSTESMAERLTRFCRDELRLALVDKGNGITPLPGLTHRQRSLRVAIHPMASTTDKCWLASRFIGLAIKLRDSGFDPQFVVAPEERAHWTHIEQFGLTLADLGPLDQVAAWLYESGWFIGNDSGVGHLASSLQIPTLSLFMRRGTARTWRPGWGVGQVLIGSAYLPTGRLKERYWKYMLSVNKVSQAFDRLRALTANA